MIYFKPSDEMSLRHLFSSDLGEQELKMTYISPVYNQSGSIETSPDCLVLDKRTEDWKIKRCEFKYIPIDKKDFLHNGNFDIAVIWALPNSLSKEKLKKELLEQNGCQEIIIMSEYKLFNHLSESRLVNSAKEFYGGDKLQASLKRLDFPAVYCAYIAAEIYPQMFDGKKMVELLSKKFAQIRQINPRGRGAPLSALKQTTLIKRMHGSMYRWNDDINPKYAVVDISYIIKENFLEELPDADTVNSFKRMDLS